MNKVFSCLLVREKYSNYWLVLKIKYFCFRLCKTVFHFFLDKCTSRGVLFLALSVCLSVRLSVSNTGSQKLLISFVEFCVELEGYKLGKWHNLGHKKSKDGWRA